MKTRGTDHEFPRYGAGEHLDSGPEINQIPPEFNEVRPDINFFNEMPMADREHISGNGDPGEGIEPLQKEKKEKRQGAMRSLLKAMGKGAASAVAVAALIAVTAEAVAPNGTVAQRVRQMLRPLRERPAVRTQTAMDPEGYALLWNDLPNAPHDYDEEHIIVFREPSCTEDGSYQMICRQCGEVNTVMIAALGHTPGDEKEEDRTEPSCMEDGHFERAVFCSVCGAELSRETVVLTAIGHTPDEAVEENYIGTDCTTGGSYDSVIYCKVCGEEISRETVTFAAAGHVPGDSVEENRTEALCLTDGSYDNVVYCSVCGAEIERTAVVIPAAGTHTAAPAVEENRTAATCTTDGHYDNVVYCSVCNEQVSRETVTLAATGHTAGTASRENEHDATCTAEGGYDTVTRCTVCNEIISSEHTAFAALGHHYDDIHYSITSVAEDYATKCSRCGAYALTCSFVNSNTIQYSLDPAFAAQAAAMGAGMMEFDVLAYSDEERTFANWLGGFGDEVTATSGTFTCDFAERDEPVYYEITLRFAESGSSDDVIFLWPSAGHFMTYMP